MASSLAAGSVAAAENLSDGATFLKAEHTHLLFIISSKRLLHRLSFQLRQRSQQVVFSQLTSFK